MTDNKKIVYDHINLYTNKSWITASSQLAMTLTLYYFCLAFNSIWMSPLLALTIVRLFIQFHDMCHYAFFPTKSANWLVANIISPIVFTPPTFWKKSHDYHHTNSNKINVPQHGQTATWDWDKYNNSSYLNKLKYRITYGKYTLFTINPFIYFIVMNRFLSRWYEFILQAMFLYGLYVYLDSSQYLYYFTSMWLAGVVGVMLFHIQHTFDGVYRASQDWSHYRNGMMGCSFLQVPFFLRPFLCNIQYHHIHHLNSSVPCYNLKKCHDEGEELFENVPKVYLSDIPAYMAYSVYNVSTRHFDDVYSK